MRHKPCLEYPFLGHLVPAPEPCRHRWVTPSAHYIGQISFMNFIRPYNDISRIHQNVDDPV